MVTEATYTTLSWDEWKTLFKKTFGFAFLSMDSIADHRYKNGAEFKWNSLSNWEDLDDIEIFEKLVELHSLTGQLYVITEASYKDGFGPFFLSKESALSFVKNHLNRFGECFFNGDVLIFDLGEKYIWIFHHEGVFSFLNANATSSN